MKKILIGYVVLMLFCSCQLLAQDIHFSQFYETSILRNPSFTGIFTGDYKVGVVYRSQWSSISKPYQTGVVNAETRIPVRGMNNDFVSIGLLAYYDKAGSVSLQTLTLYPALNYNKSLSSEKNTYLSVGFTGGFIQRSFDPSKATFDNQYQNGRYDPSYATGESFTQPSFNQLDMGAGFSFNTTTGQDNNINIVLGAAGYHFSRPKYSFFNDRNINIAMRLNLSAGLSVQASEKFSYQLHANYMSQGAYNELIAGGLLGWNKTEPSSSTIMFSIFGGIFYRFRDAIIPTVKVRYHDLSFGMSYDANVSKLTAASNLRGGYELTIVKTGLFRDPKYQKARTLCPHFY
ncbi:MAG: PorP/SprF family type IX secretion system membrane protein [Chitinophagaceae bacterium]|nr:PorP/SprF family type IX secretion system membrane protein [Chitinophagaceae bacterium]MCB9045082.1 PorP/SprF family type IX secretion system membrane protein [Chitinophagales bacterium]